MIYTREFKGKKANDEGIGRMKSRGLHKEEDAKLTITIESHEEVYYGPVVRGPRKLRINRVK